jgi:hypothetical protein
MLQRKTPVHSLFCFSREATETHNHDPNHHGSLSYLLGATFEYPFRIPLDHLSLQESIPLTDLIEPLYRPEQGYCTSIGLDTLTYRYITSFRLPSIIATESKSPSTTMHFVAEACALSPETAISTFQGQTSHQILLSRPLLFSSPMDSPSPKQLAAISNESTYSLELYDVTDATLFKSPTLFQNLPATSSSSSNASYSAKGILDACHIAHPYYGDFLSIVTSESVLLLHSWRPSLTLDYKSLI